MNPIYLDNNATTRPADEVVQAMTGALTEYWPNPSSGHRPGQAARHQIDLARESIAELIGCKDRELIFTSGGTEADNLAILGSLAAQNDRNVFVTCPSEHDAVRDTAEVAAGEGAEVIWLPVDQDGVIDCDTLEGVLKSRANEIALVSIMWANNETGVIQPVEQIGTLCREHGVRFHTDAVQLAGKMPVDVSTMPIDLLSFSGHKFHGPKGAGGLFIRKGIRLAKRSIGGAQEYDRRGGTENVPGILGLAAASRLAVDWLQTGESNRLAELRDRFERELRNQIDDVIINGGSVKRTWNTANIAFRGLQADAIILVLSERGIYASAGAACASGSLEPSPVLRAMGVAPEYAHGAVRFSLSRFTSEQEIDAAIETISKVISVLRGDSSRD